MQEQIYEFLKKKKVRLTVSKLAEVFKVEQSTMDRMVRRIWNNRDTKEFKGFSRDQEIMDNSMKRPYVAYVYYIK